MISTVWYVFFTGHNLIQQTFGVLQSVGYRDVQHAIAELHTRFFHDFNAADLDEIQLFTCLTGELLVSGAQRGLHHSAGGAENVAGAGRHAERGVEIGVAELAKFDAERLYHPDDFTRRHDGVGPRGAPRRVMLGAARLVLLGRTGHDGHIEDLSGIQPFLFGVVRFGQDGKHAHRRTACGCQRNQLGIEMLEEFDPSGGA